ncbi:MAG: hypothetical protein MRY23_05080 [Pelagibacteraceae bacterium]|nr:hypothetical protein [Pelagibacteraceae bacterium]MCI5079047.1 hypothetical protein [Pelagibacteraceae bacterium]
MKLFFKILSALIFIIFITLVVLSYGISTDKFNNKIITQIEKRIPNLKANFKEANISLDIFTLGLKIKINKPEILVNKQSINLKSFTIFSDLKSSFEEKYLLQKIEVDFDDNKILNLKKISLIKKVPVLDQTKFLDGIAKGNLIIDQFQKQKVSTTFTGELKNVSIDIYEDIPFVKDLTGNIDFENNKIVLSNIIGVFGTFGIKSDEVSYSIDNRELRGNIKIDGQLKSSLNLNKISTSLLNLNLEKIKDIGGQLTLNSNLDIQLDNNFKVIKDKTQFNINTTNLNFKYSDPYEFDFKNINSLIKFDRKGQLVANGDFVLNNKKNNFAVNRKSSKDFFDIKLNGEINLKETFFKKNDFLIKDDLNYNIKTKLKDFKKFNIETSLDLSNSEVDLSLFNYTKNKGVNSKLNFVFYKNNKNIKISKLNFVSKNDRINIQSIYLDEKFNLKDFDNIKINLGDNNKLRVTKNKRNYLIKGEKLDLRRVLNQRERNKDIEFNSMIDGSLKVDLKKIFLPSASLINYKNTSLVKRGTITKLNSFANFDDLTTFSHEVKNNKAGNKELIIRSDKAKPFLSNYEFLKGLDKGTLDIRRETLSKDFSVTEIKINDFYLKEMPILTNILSIASLTGALDILEGKGIFFKEAYLKYELRNNELKIIECYGTGPSLGFIIEGRVGADNFTSLSGSLAPANTINNIVRGIPIIGKVLTGKKGDGIFGASFKIKGTKELKTEVNPIRTITPRFVQRFLAVFKK